MTRARVWLALLAMPLGLAAAFAALVAVLVGVRGVPADTLEQVVPSHAPWAVVPAMALSFAVTRALARRDGLDLHALGWRQPSLADAGIGLGAVAVLLPLHQLVFAPMLVRAQPGFDPALRTLALLPAAVMLLASVVAEDTLYRGYALEVLRARWGSLAAIAVTSFAYALLAPGFEFPLKLWALGLGVVLGLLRLAWPSLWPVAVVHAALALGPKLLALADA